MIQFPDQPQIATLCSGMPLAFLLKFLHITVFPGCTCRRTCCRTVCSSTMMLVVLHSVFCGGYGGSSERVSRDCLKPAHMVRDNISCVLLAKVTFCPVGLRFPTTPHPSTLIIHFLFSHLHLQPRIDLLLLSPEV